MAVTDKMTRTTSEPAGEEQYPPFQPGLLRHHPEFFRHLTENVNDLVVVIDADFRMLWVSASIRRILGSWPGELINTSLIEIVVQDDRDFLHSALQRTIQDSDQFQNFRVRLRLHNGSVRIFEFVSRNLLNDPVVAGLILSGRDVTAAEEATAAIRRREIALENIAEINEVLLHTPNWQHSIFDILSLLGEAAGASEVTVRQTWDPARDRATENCWKWVEPTLRNGIDGYDSSNLSQPLAETKIHDGISDCRHGGSPITFLIHAGKHDWGRISLCCHHEGWQWQSVAHEMAKAVARALSNAAQRSKSDQRLRLLQNGIDNLSIGMTINDCDGTIIYANAAAAEMHGFSIEEMIGMRGRDLAPTTLSQNTPIEERHKHPFLQHESENLRKDGSVFPVQLTSTVVRDENNELIGTVTGCEDITLRRRVEYEIKKSRTELQRLTGHLQTAREDERKAVAQTIHDELGQVLSALKMDASVAKRNVDNQPEAAREIMDSMIDLLDDAIRTVQRLATDLRPSILDNLGIEAAIEWHVGEFSRRSGIECHLDIDSHDDEIDPNVSTAVFRILQECLNNVLRHANASEAEIAFKTTVEIYRLSVRDNGRGVPAQKLDDPKSLGLIGIRERARSFGGAVDITSFEGIGTKVIVMIPRLPATKERS